MPEFDLIGRLQQAICLPSGESVTGCEVGIGDDAAVLDLRPGEQFVVCTDSLVESVHFPRETAPEAVGHKALAVNLSDLASMGAQPAFFFLALTIPGEDAAWLESFSLGMARLAGQYRIQLSGGDTTSGPLSITITALGTVEKGQALLRSGAKPGDLIVVSGTPGMAAHALQALQAGLSPEPSGKNALDFPQPRISLGRALAGLATSCIDLSDGLAADLGHVLKQSGVGAVVEPDLLPCPPGMAGMPEEERWRLQLAGGDDYELCFTIPGDAAGRLDQVAKAGEVALTVIGRIVDHPGLELLTKEGDRFQLGSQGYNHFSGNGAAS